jgi:plasmid stabilization system protein ParE
MKVEWSDAALADLDRFATFLRQQRPSLAGIVAEEIIKRVELLADHPMLGPL